MFFKHFASKSQLPDFYISGTLVENGLIVRQRTLRDTLCLSILHRKKRYELLVGLPQP